MTKRAMIIRVVALVCCTVVVVALMVLSYLGGSAIDFSDGLLALGGFLGGLLAAFGLRNKSLGVGLVAFCLVSSTACSMQPAQVARATLDTTRAVMDALEGEVPIPDDHRDEADSAIAATRGALALGEIAVEMWEERGDAPPGWSKWVSAALAGIEVVVGILKECGVRVPPYVQVAITALAGLMPAVAGAT